MLKLQSLPYEVLANIVENLSFDDILNLGLTGPELQYLLVEERICKFITQTKVPHSKEAREALVANVGYAAALRRVAKRREAIAKARPFTVAAVGFCDTFIYMNGVLCYTLDGKIRLLNLHQSSQEERVLSISRLLAQAISGFDNNANGTFQVLYYANDILSCVYRPSSSDSAGWMIVIGTSEKNLASSRILIVEELESSEKLFVRHNEDFLYYGTHSELGTDGCKKWVIQGYHVSTQEKFPRKIHLSDLGGSDIGSTVCFEIYNDYFYALSNQTSIEIEELDWTSFYHCVRFPLEHPYMERRENTESRCMWRRQHQEGPIDDRWTSLRLDVNEETGDLRIVEARKEWYLGSSNSKRTYYTTDLLFEKTFQQDYMDNKSTSSTASSNSTPIHSYAETSSSLSLSANTSFSSTASEETYDLAHVPPIESSTKTNQADDSPQRIHPPTRLPQEVHPIHQTTFFSHTLAKTHVRTYHTSCNTSVDLIDDRLTTDWQCTQRLRLRTSSRRSRSPLRDSFGLLQKPSSDLQTALGQLYQEQGVHYWPPDQDGSDEVNALYRVLNPPSHLGNVEGVMDERSLVYATGGKSGHHALIFVGFDPAVQLMGLKRWENLSQGKARRNEGLNKKGKGIGEGPYVVGRAAGSDGDVGESTGMEMDGECKADEQVGESTTSASQYTLHAQNESWIWKEKAMHKAIGLGFHFCS